MKKQIVAIALTSVLCLSGASLVACGGSSSSSNTANNTTSAATTNTTNTTNTTANTSNTTANTTSSSSASSSNTLSDSTYNTMVQKRNTLVDLYNRVADKYVNDDSIAQDPDFESAMEQVGQAIDLVDQLDKTNCTESDAQSIIKSLDTCIAAYQKAATALGV